MLQKNIVSVNDTSSYWYALVCNGYIFIDVYIQSLEYIVFYYDISLCKFIV